MFSAVSRTNRSLVTFLGILMVLVSGSFYLVYAADRHKTPYVEKTWTGEDTCYNTDYPPCPGRFIQVKNPLLRTVVVEVSCLPRHNLTDEARIGPGGSAVFNLASGTPGGIIDGDCSISKWRFHK
jgi:hypothetical protein